MKVLVVTQQEEVARIIDESLASSGDEVFFATDLAAGLALSVEHSPEIAMIDIALAGGAALAMVHHVIASSAKTAIYVLAAPTAFEIAAEALSLGAAGLMVAPPTGDAVLRAIAEVQSRLASEERVAKLATDVRDGAELVDAMTQALLIAKTGDLRVLAETLLPLFLIASGARGVAVYGEETRDAGTRKRIAGYGTALELLDRYSDLELAQLATARQGEVIGLAVEARMYGCVLLERPDPMRTARVHRVIEFATALMPLCALARAAIAEDNTIPRSRALPSHVFEPLVQRDVDAARDGREVSLVCALGRDGVIDTGPLGPVLGLAGAAIGMGQAGEAFVLLPKTPLSAARTLVLDIPLAVGLASAPADGRKADALLRVARARARRALNGFPQARELRGKSLVDVLVAITGSQHPSMRVIELGREALESVILQACRHARASMSAEVVVAHAGDVGALVASVRAAAGQRASVRDVTLVDAALAGLLVTLVLTPRAGWGLVMRESEGRVQAIHTSDDSALELLRSRIAEVA